MLRNCIFFTLYVQFRLNDPYRKHYEVTGACICKSKVINKQVSAYMLAYTVLQARLL